MKHSNLILISAMFIWIFNAILIVKCHVDKNDKILYRIRDCSIVLLNGDRGSKMPAPYVDEHGETDERLRYYYNN